MKLIYDLLLYVVENYDYNKYENNVNFSGIIEISIKIIVNAKMFVFNEEIITSASNISNNINERSFYK